MKRAILCAATLLLVSGAWGQTTSTGNLIIDPISPSFHLVEIDGENGEMLAQINLDGTITFGKNYKPDEAARIFWKAIGDIAPAKREKEAPPVLGNATVVDDLSYHIRWNSVEAVEEIQCNDAYDAPPCPPWTCGLVQEPLKLESDAIPAPHWQDMGPVHLYNATCPAGYTYEQIAPGWIAGQPMYIANPDQQISATEMPTNTPAGTCVKEKP